jgi:hypothetical protein
MASSSPWASPSTWGGFKRHQRSSFNVCDLSGRGYRVCVMPYLVVISVTHPAGQLVLDGSVAGEVAGEG